MVGVQKSLKHVSFDLSALAGHFCAGWREALRWPVFAWLLVSQTHRVVQMDGSIVTYAGDKRLDRADSAGVASALMLPEDLVLRRTLRLPRLLDEELYQAAMLEAAAISPFDDDELLWGYVSVPHQDGFNEVQVAITSLRQAERCLDIVRQNHGDSLPIDDTIQFWAPGEPPIVLRQAGSGQPRAAQSSRSVLRKEAWLMLLAALLSGAVAVTPAAKVRLRAIEAQHSYDALAASVKPLVDSRERLIRANQQLQEVAELMSERGNPLAVLDELSRLLPDDVVLNRLEISGQVVRIAGTADNAAGLMGLISANSAFGDIRAPSPATRPPGATKDSFVIEFSVVHPQGGAH